MKSNEAQTLLNESLQENPYYHELQGRVLKPEIDDWEVAASTSLKREETGNIHLSFSDAPTQSYEHLRFKERFNGTLLYKCITRFNKNNLEKLQTFPMNDS